MSVVSNEIAKSIGGIAANKRARVITINKRSGYSLSSAVTTAATPKAKLLMVYLLRTPTGIYLAPFFKVRGVCDRCTL